MFPSYIEISPSGDGLHIFISCKIDFKGAKTYMFTHGEKEDGDIERYVRGRYFTVTGNVYKSYNELGTFEPEYFLKWHNSLIKETKNEIITQSQSYDNLLPDDGKILKVMFASKNGGKLKDLYEGNWKKYSPKPIKSHSEADLSFVSSLMFFCRNNTQIVDRIFRSSGLMREKWNREDIKEGIFQKSLHNEVMEWGGYENDLTKKVNSQKAGEIFGKIAQAKAFIEKQPIFYSPEGLLWFWNFKRYCYELKDEVDLLNGIRGEMMIDTINGRSRTEILSALKQVGREQAPQKKPKGWIQFNGVLINPKTLEKTTADYKYFLTNPIPHKLGESEETPEINRLLREWAVKEGVQDESYVQSLYEYIAYALTDDLFMQRIIALTGGGSNGKGTFLKLIEQLLGRNNCISVDIKKLSTNNFAMSSIYKKLVAFAGEVGYNDLASTNVLKKITGEDLIEYEFKGKTSFTDDCITTFFIATNSLPITPDKSTGFYRRWVITDFPNIFDIKADVLSGVSEKEYENLCFKSVNILKKLYDNRKFVNEGNYEERERKYEERSNPLPTFIEENCEEEAGCKIKLQEFWNKYNAWLKSKKLRIITIIQLGKQLRGLGQEVARSKFPNEPNTTSVAVQNQKWKQKNTENTENTEFQILNLHI